MKILRDKSGFTLVELVTTMVITSIMAIAIGSTFTFVTNMSAKYAILDEQATIINLIKTDLQTNLTYSKSVSFSEKKGDSEIRSFGTEEKVFLADGIPDYNLGIFSGHDITMEFSGSTNLLTFSIDIAFDDITSNEQYSFKLLNNELDISEDSLSNIVYFKNYERASDNTDTPD